MKNNPDVPQAERRGGKRREGAKSGVARLERMKHGSGIKDRNDKSMMIESVYDHTNFMVYSRDQMNEN